MRLLQLQEDGDFSLVEYVRDIPPYAILSHTWGEDCEEVTFNDLIHGTGSGKVGYQKLRFCGKQAANDNLSFFWVDTCCIDKSSSAELSEAINSMFRWYQNAARCYVYLSDVSSGTNDEEGASLRRWKPEFKKSRWFTRGWTLQELIAPKSAAFFSKEGERLGDKHSLEQTLHDVTEIDIEALRGRSTSSFSVEERMSWAAKRQTKREEDAAYSMLGIFDIFIPLIYGEGRQNAMNRVREEIKKSSKVGSADVPAPHTPAQANQHDNRPWTVPFSKDPNFVKRSNVLDRVHERCSVPGGRAALVGIGGVGKSQLAIQYCHDVRNTSMQPWVFWVHVGTRARFEEGYRRIAEAVKMEGYNNPKADVLQLVRSWLCNESNGRWVMVIDNADDSNVLFPPCNQTRSGDIKDLSEAEEPLSDFIPQSPNGSVLVTSRSRDVAYRLTGSNACIIEINPMDRDDAMVLFRKILQPGADQGNAAHLLEALDYMPLAITQAAAYIEQRAPQMTITRYLDVIRSGGYDQGRLLMEDVGDYRRDARASNSILKTWQISFEYIRNQKPTAARLLSIMSFFDRQGIPESLLQARYQVVDTESNFEEDIHTLISYSLVRMSEKDDEFEMHRLVQFSTRKWLEFYDEVEEWKELFLTALNKALPNAEYENWKTCERLLPHAEAAMEYSPRRKESVAQWGLILYKAARYAHEKGQYSKAEEMARRALYVEETFLGSEHIATLSTSSNLGRALLRQGRYREAEEIRRHILNVKEKELRLEHPDTPGSAISAGSVLMYQGKYKEAEAMHRRVLEGYKKVLGLEHLYTLTSFHNLGTVLARQGKYKEAEAMHRRALEGHKKVLGLEHPQTLSSFHKLGIVLEKQGKYKDAEAMYQRLAEGYTKVLGPEHPRTLSTISSLGSVLKKQHKYEDAEILYRRSLEGFKKVFGPEHPFTLTIARNLERLLRIMEP